MSKYTPGPWKAYTKRKRVWVASLSANTAVATLRNMNPRLDFTTDKEKTANAKLIAAAPDLLKACELADEWHDLIKQDYPEMMRPFEAIRTAISKATD